MRKELLILTVILLMSFTSISQSVTPPDSIICLPIEWVKNIVVELCMVGPEKDGSLKEWQEIVAKKNLPVRLRGF